MVRPAQGCHEDAGRATHRHFNEPNQRRKRTSNPRLLFLIPEGRMLKRQTSFGILAICLTAISLGCESTENSVKPDPNTNPDDGPPPGNPDGKCAIPAEAQAEDTSKPDHVVGTGSPES